MYPIVAKSLNLNCKFRRADKRGRPHSANANSIGTRTLKIANPFGSRRRWYFCASFEAPSHEFAQCAHFNVRNRFRITDSILSLDGKYDDVENAAMQPQTPRPIYVRRIDPTQNMRRFYQLEIQPTLFGGASLVRNWGRIGTGGQLMVETFDQAEEATVAFERLIKSKRKKGYAETRQER